MQEQYVPYEKQYLDNVKNIMTNGTPCDAERTGTGTRMLTGLGYRVDLSKEFPILSTKEIDLKKVFFENQWFISGSTSNDDLLATGTKFWTGWEDDNGQLGPLYGAMWRRRPATNIRYEETAPIPGYFEHKKITKHFVRTKCKKTPNLKGIICTNVKTRTALIHALWYDMMARAAAEGATVEDNWLTVEGFTKDFPRIAGNELLHLATDKSAEIKAKKLVVVNYQTGHNAYNIDVACIVPEYLAKEYPRHEVQNKDGSNTFLCPIFYIDQVEEALDLLRDHSQSRRIVIDCWDPSLTPVDGLRPSLQPMLGLQSLAPCHPLFQFNVVPSANGEPARLDLCVYMR